VVGITYAPGIWGTQVIHPPIIVTKTNGGGSGGDSNTGGDGPSPPGQACALDPCNVSTGNVYESVTDYTTSGQNALSFTRYYNSLAAPDPYVSELGTNWRHSFDRYLNINGSTVTAERSDGQQVIFTNTNGSWSTDSDVDLTLTNSGLSWTLTNHNDTVETYTQLPSGEGQLQTIVTRDGYTQNLAYSGGLLASVTDSYGRKLSFIYNSSNQLTQVATPDALTLSYAYSSSGATPGVNDQLASVTYNTSPSTSQTYAYVNNFDLASVTDENGNVFSSWTYNAQNQVLSNQHAGGAEQGTVAYNTDGSSVVTNALGQTTSYVFTTLQNVPKISAISRTATATVPAATENFTYDSNGYTASQTDWNGNLTTYVNDIHGNPTTITEAANTPQARTTNITYIGTLPGKIVTPRLTTIYTYDASGNPLTRTETDTSGGATNGQVHTWTYTYDSTGHLLTAINPLGAVTTYTYSGNNIATVKDALGHVSKVTSYTGGGLPLVALDPNGVQTTFTYDTKNRITSRTTDGATTQFAYDAVGNMITLTQPDNSQLSYTYDAAHRVTAVKNNVGESIAYTYDANDDIVQQQTSGASITKTQSAVFDSLGRMLQQIGAAGQTTTFGYDANGNRLTTTDPLNNASTQTFDALNRLIQSTDPLHNTTANAYDVQDNLTSLTDPRSIVTSYTYDGFGQVLSETSPDAGTTTYTLDANGNRIKQTDARGIVTNRTFDKLNRVLTETYPSDRAENVTYTYDRGTYGIGHLSSITDQSGETEFTYNARGDVLTDARTINGRCYTTSYTYDLADHVTSITYPDRRTVSYTRDTVGRISGLSMQRQPVVSNVTYKPFGPVAGFTFGNGIKAQYTYDMDYRLTSILATGREPIQNLAMSYDAAGNITAINDAVGLGDGDHDGDDHHDRDHWGRNRERGYDAPLSLSQSFTYDPDYRLLTATGAYGSEAFTYDGVGNRLSEAIARDNKTHTRTYSYATTSNRLASITHSDDRTHALTYDAAGNTLTDDDLKLTYDARNRNTSVSTEHDHSHGWWWYWFGHDRDHDRDDHTSGGANYLYNALGQRVSKDPQGRDHIFNSGSTQFIYDQQGHLIAEDGKEYIYMNSLLIAVLDGNEVYYVHSDNIGTPQKMTDGDQKVVWERVAEPFGETVSIKGPATLNIRFQGQYHDNESGLDYNDYRSYASEIGRYTQSDPIGLAGGLNTFGYVMQNPVRYTDPKGLETPSVTNSYPPNNPAYPQPYIPKVTGPEAVCELGASKPCYFLLPENPPLGAACIIGTSVACPYVADPTWQTIKKIFETPQECTPSNPQGVGPVAPVIILGPGGS